MNETLIYLLVILGILLVPLVSILLNYYFERKKLAAETEKIQLQNKITKETMTRIVAKGNFAGQSLTSILSQLRSAG